MLSRRISLLRTYLDSLPPSYLSDPTLPLNSPATDDHGILPNHSILRSISATLARINILSPPDTAAFTVESQREASDVQLVALLSAMTNSIAAAKDFGTTSFILETLRNTGRKSQFPPHSGSMGSMGLMGPIGMMGGEGGGFLENTMLRNDPSERWT